MAVLWWVEILDQILYLTFLVINHLFEIQNFGVELLVI